MNWPIPRGRISHPLFLEIIDLFRAVAFPSENKLLVKEYEKTIEEIQKFQVERKAAFLKGSNLDDTLYSKKLWQTYYYGWLCVTELVTYWFMEVFSTDRGIKLTNGRQMLIRSFKIFGYSFQTCWSVWCVLLLGLDFLWEFSYIHQWIISWMYQYGFHGSLMVCLHRDLFGQ